MTSAQASKTRVVLLGTGTPNADPARSGPSLAVVVGDTPYLVDFGPGVVRRAAAACESGIRALEVSRLARAFATHLHSDHTAGYADLILTPWVLGREEPLRVYGPPGLRSMTEHLLAAYAEDIRERIEGLEPANPSGHRVEAFEIEPGRVYEDSQVVVDTFAVNHGSWPAFGYRFTTTDRVIVVSGDTAPFLGWADAYRGCDVLVHEVQSAAGLDRREPGWRTYHAAVHTSTIELADVVSVVKPKLLVLTHHLFHGEAEQTLLQEVRSRYDGDVVLGHDLEVF
ncbi:MBL fold metallo-hydrolase [Candidatus Bipolaricaulota bacterium]|nr:MBL fold metallo-hydrolase [Candidatus Bipolaricaulota bacterium]